VQVRVKLLMLPYVASCGQVLLGCNNQMHGGQHACRTLCCADVACDFRTQVTAKMCRSALDNMSGSPAGSQLGTAGLLLP
jgi:hypothetical protein